MVAITIRDVPAATRNELAARAALGGRSLQEYLRGQLVELAARPDRATVLARISERVERERVELTVDEIAEAKNAGQAMSLVLDASAAVAALIDVGERGRWARRALSQGHLMAPHLLHAEVTNSLRRLVAGDVITPLTATVARGDLADLGTELYPFEPFADRVWALRGTITAYDAWYVALAEAHDVPLATLDRRLVAASGPQCDFATPGQRSG